MISRKRVLKTVFIALSLASTLFICASYYDYNEYKPVLMERDAMENAVESTSARAIVFSGKIYRYQNYMFLVDKSLGVHVYDISNPAEPQNKGFIVIPGCSEVAVSDGYLYANSAVDLLSINILNFPAIDVTDRKRNLFPEIAPPDGYIPGQFNKRSRPENTVIIDWIANDESNNIRLE